MLTWFKVVLSEDEAGEAVDMRQFEDQNELYKALLEEGVEFVRIEPFQKQMEAGLKELRWMVDARLEAGELAEDEYDAMSTVLHLAEDEMTGE